MAKSKRIFLVLIVVVILVVASGLIYQSLTAPLFGSPASGPPCDAIAHYYCPFLSLLTNGTVSFGFSQTTGHTLYNIQASCSVSNATMFSSIGTKTTLMNDTGAQVNHLQCYRASGVPLQNLSIGSSFNGYIWLRYTNYSTTNGTVNLFYTVRMAVVSTKVV